MGLFKNLVGITGDVLQLRGPLGTKLKDVVGGFTVRNAADDDYAHISAKPATGSSRYHIATWGDVRDTNVLLQFSFSGATAPTPGDNADTYGICHTSGGAYTAGQIYYDDGTTLTPIKTPLGMKITTGSAVAGTISLIANGSYAAHTATAPFNWTLKGDGLAGGHGVRKTLIIDINTSASKQSTTSIPAGARVHNVRTNIDSPYDNDPEIEVKVAGTSSLVVQGAAENFPGSPNLYVSDVVDGDVTASTEGPVEVTVSNAPSTGSGKVIVEFTPVNLG